MRYTKMHGAGNSFVIVESLHGELQGEDLSVLALRLCDEKTGPGADGMIVVVPAADADFGMLFYNSDGSLGEMCGNGARCVARYGVERGLAPDPACIRVRATAGLVTGRRVSETDYQVRLNDPSVIDLHRQAEGEDCAYAELGQPGIPHAVVEVGAEAFDDLDALRERGRRLRHSAAFPRGANVTFACLTGGNRVRAITFERGVEDFTLACGTGTGAVVSILTMKGKVSGKGTRVTVPGGELRIDAEKGEDGRIKAIYLTGPTNVVSEGEVRDEDLQI